MSKYDLYFSSPVLNVAGTLGFSPDPRGPVDLAQLGAFITNPISLAPRTPARGPRCLPYPGGFLLHTGYPNPGLSAVLQYHAPRWARASLPVIVHLLASHPEEVQIMAARLESVPGVIGLEIGLPPQDDLHAARLDARQFTKAVAGELPVIVRLPLDWALDLASLALDAGASAVSLAPPRGALPAPAVVPVPTSATETHSSPSHSDPSAPAPLVTGRLFGPALFPHVLATVRRLSAVLPGPSAVIASGGVYRPQDIDALLAAGALAVQLDSWLWRFGFRAPM